MKSPYTVVVGIDYSEVSRLAFREALEIASGRVGSEVHVVHVETPQLIARVVSHVRANTPSREIAQLAMDLEADLLVVGTHGRTGIARFLLGSVAHALVTLAPCPVLVVRPKQTSLVPIIEPPCPRCVEARRESGGLQLWCDQHRAQRNRRHIYYQEDRSAEETNFPLVFSRSGA